jgi:hypothetical protein
MKKAIKAAKAETMMKAAKTLKIVKVMKAKTIKKAKTVKTVKKAKTVKNVMKTEAVQEAIEDYKEASTYLQRKERQKKVTELLLKDFQEKQQKNMSDPVKKEQLVKRMKRSADLAVAKTSKMSKAASRASEHYWKADVDERTAFAKWKWAQGVTDWQW